MCVYRAGYVVTAGVFSAVQTGVIKFKISSMHTMLFTCCHNHLPEWFLDLNFKRDSGSGPWALLFMVQLGQTQNHSVV